MTHDIVLEQVVSHLDALLNIPRQVWLLGAGISRDAGIPLMYPLTDRVESLLSDKKSPLKLSGQSQSANVYKVIKGELDKVSHVEHILSQLGDLISYTERKKDNKVEIGGQSTSAEELRLTHRHVQLAIRHTVECGFLRGSNGTADRIGTLDKPIVDRKYHDQFVDSLFTKRRAGLEQNPPIHFVTTNYDTLMEDALAHAHVGCVDGFSGGATGFWDPRNRERRLEQTQRLTRHTATICKLHGSVDWIADNNDVVMRVRSTAIDSNDESQQLLIYPQATKYQVTQRDPFATLFAEFRSALGSAIPTVLIVCGYSFGDEHINEEIERALKVGPSTLTLLALCSQTKDEDGKLTENMGLPDAIVRWMKHEQFCERVIVAGSDGYYRGSLDNRVPDNSGFDWWTFKGITKLLSDGPEAIQ
ncbi:hypothetical protein Pan258_35240 [Symmachiella dynata]|uniref:SIR2 family protein n=1 Tax=Symmachiella dynata TaxID=2527995 RepID=UPI00118B0C90|nr:SIR2 family protein [Symmachiella dynata]QDT49475.1 hypothetical protein Pan258_35240 [Symmachiella dynata]